MCFGFYNYLDKLNITYNVTVFGFFIILLFAVIVEYFKPKDNNDNYSDNR